MHPTALILLHHPERIAAAAACLLAITGIAAMFLMRKKISPEEREERRRFRLAEHGRIIDGTLIDTAPHLELADLDKDPPQALIYRYRIAGVTYECGQDISRLTPLLPDLGPSSSIFGMPVQVRYDRDNPADSIILAETWNGLWHQGVPAHDSSR